MPDPFGKSGEGRGRDSHRPGFGRAIVTGAGARGGIKARLSGSDLRSIGNSNEVAHDMSEDPAMIAEAMNLLSGEDPVLRARVADALEKATRESPTLIQPHKKAVLRLASTARQAEVRWHVAQILPRLRLTTEERTRGLAILRDYFGDPSRIVQVCAMQALWEMGSKGGSHEAWVVRFVRQKALDGGPAIRARARRLLARSEDARPNRSSAGGATARRTLPGRG